MANGDRWRSEQDQYGNRDDDRDRWRNERGSRDDERSGRSGDYRGEGRGFRVGEYGEGSRFGDYRGGGEGYWRGYGGEYRGGIGGYGTGREDRRDFGRGYGAGYGRDYGGRGFGRDEYGRGAFERGSGGFRERRYGGDYGRESFGRGSVDYGRPGEERGFWERASDEVSSWFGDQDAQRHRREDMRGQHRGRGPKNYTRSDERIREDVNDRLSDDPFVDASDIEVQVSSCEVTLSGTVDSRGTKRRAEDIAERVSGVKHVQNNLRVNQQGTGGAWARTSATLGTAARPDLVRTKGSPDDFVTGNTTPDAAQRDKGDVPGPGLGSV